MPVATQASLKGLTPQQLEETGCRLCLNNTYHLGLKPGQDVLESVGGAHKLQGWKHNILTDSGGYGSSLMPISGITNSSYQLPDG
jgi:queuine tRNA-ribosyltransferase catalytic subunit